MMKQKPFIKRIILERNIYNVHIKIYLIVNFTVVHVKNHSRNLRFISDLAHSRAVEPEILKNLQKTRNFKLFKRGNFEAITIVDIQR